MLLLAFDTSLDKTYVGLSENGKILSSKIIENTDTNYHSAYLISTIASVINDNRIKPQDITAIAINVGPGSFTGIRACTTVARVMAQQLNIKTIGVSSLEILSKLNPTEKKVLVLLDARKNMAYAWDKELLGAIAINDIKEMIINNDYFIVADDNMYKIFKEFTDNIISYTTIEHNLGEILMKIATDEYEQRQSDWKQLTPLYIQPPPVFS